MPSPSSIRSMFSAISPRYDLLNRLLSFNVHSRWRRATAREICQPETKRVLDVCGGTGDLSLACLKAVPGGSAVCADFARPMLLLAAAKAARRGKASQIACVECDGLRLPFPDRSFDAAAVAFGLRNMADPLRGIQEMTRLVRPGGKVAILEFSLPANPLLRRLYLFYFLRVLPAIGNLVSGSKAYRYLAESVIEWPSPERLATMMREAGLGEVRFRRLTFGVACLHVGIVAY